jgi:hypothetical protein
MTTRPSLAAQVAADVAEQQAQWTARLRQLSGTPYREWVILRTEDVCKELRLARYEYDSLSARIGLIMRSLGWNRVYMRFGTERSYIWRRHPNYKPPEALEAGPVQPKPAPQGRPFSVPLPPEPVPLPEVIDGRYGGSIELNGETVALDSDLGKKLILSCAMFDEGVRSVDDVLLAHDMTRTAWDDLRLDRHLQKAVRALVELRAGDGTAGALKANVYSSEALDSLRDIHRNPRAPASARAASAATILKTSSINAGGGPGRPGRAPSGGPWALVRISGRVVSQPPSNVEPEVHLELNLGTRPPPEPTPIIDVTPVQQP